MSGAAATGPGRWRPPRLWAIGGSVGVIIAACVFAALYPTHFSPLARQARALGYNPAPFIAVHELSASLRAPGSVTPDEMARLEALARDPDPRIRARAMTLACRVRGARYRAVAVGLLDSGLGDRAGVVRGMAILGLARLKTQDARSEAERLTHDPDPGAVDAAKMALQRLGAASDASQRP